MRAEYIDTKGNSRTFKTVDKAISFLHGDLFGLSPELIRRKGTLTMVFDARKNYYR